MIETETWPVASGWQWRVRALEDGQAEAIRGGWAPTEAAAESRAQEVAADV